MREKSAPGWDGIDYRILKNLPNSAKDFLLHILNEIFASGQFPSDWNKYICVCIHILFFIPKSDKSSMIPISLLRT